MGSVIKNMKRFIRLFWVALFIIVCNIEIVRLLIFRQGFYKFHSEDGSFRFKTITFKGVGYDILIADYGDSEAKKMNCKLCRSFRKNPLKFWNWYFYLTDPLCKIPYCPIPKSIKDR